MKGLYHGLQFGLTAILGLGIGYWLDRKLHTTPFGMLGGLFGGAAIGIYNLTRALKR